MKSLFIFAIGGIVGAFCMHYADVPKFAQQTNTHVDAAVGSAAASAHAWLTAPPSAPKEDKSHQ